MPDLPPEFVPGQTKLIEPLNGILAYLRSCRLSAAAPLNVRRTRDGQVLSDGRRRSFWAVLDGSAGTGSSPYVARAAYRSGGSFVAYPNAAPLPAFEVNGRSGLGGKAVRLEPGAGNDYRFRWLRLAAAAACSYTVVVRGCGGSLLSGASVTLGGYGTLVTGAGGSVTFPGVTAGSVALAISAAGYDAYSAAVSVSCPSSGATVTLAASAGFVCLTSTCPCRLMPAAMTFDDPQGSVTVNYNGSPAYPNLWSGVADRTIHAPANLVLDCSGGHPFGTGLGVVAVTVPVIFVASCQGGLSLVMPGNGAIISGVSAAAVYPNYTLTGTFCAGQERADSLGVFNSGCGPASFGVPTTACSPYSFTQPIVTESCYQLYVNRGTGAFQFSWNFLYGLSTAVTLHVHA